MGGDGCWVLTAEAGMAVVFGADHFRQILYVQIAQRIRADNLRNFLDAVFAGDQIVPGINIRTVVAGVAEGRRGNAHMDFPGSCLPDQVYNLTAGGAPDDGVIDEDNPLALYRLLDGIQLDLHLIHSLPLPRGDEGSADILVFDKANAVGNTALPGVAQGGVQTGIRHAHHQVSFHRVPSGQQLTGIFPGSMDTDTIDDGVGPSKIDILKGIYSVAP